VLVGALALSSETVFALLQRGLTSPGLRARATAARVRSAPQDEAIGAQ
jgi:hypothetical protein